MRRRKFVMLLGGAGAATWSLAAGALQQSMPVVGYLSGRSRNAETSMLEAFRKGLEEAGYIENRNVIIEFRFADGRIDRLPALAAELARRQPNVLVAVGSSAAARIARAADPELAIVFNSGSDPVRIGLVTSFNRPGGNMTGIFAVNAELVSKNVGLLHELVPKARRLALLVSRADLADDILTREQQARDAATHLGLGVAPD